MTKFVEYDIFGNEIEDNLGLRGRYGEPPFSVLDTKKGEWQERKRAWKDLGLKSEVGRNSKQGAFNFAAQVTGKINIINNDISIFDPALCEVIYGWFVPDGGSVLDPFAGGSVRGIVANKLGYKYTGIDIRQEQVDSNVEQAKLIVPGNEPRWIVGDSDKVLDTIDDKFDFLFSCPPYADLEVYSKLPGDISNMPYPQFLEAYRSIIRKACSKLKDGCLACFVVGEVRGKDGNYIGFVPDTVKAFMDCGMHYYNEAVLINPVGTAHLRAERYMKSKKLAKLHQNILVFKK